jgi:hypothetical protein
MTKREKKCEANKKNIGVKILHLPNGGSSEVGIFAALFDTDKRCLDFGLFPTSLTGFFKGKGVSGNGVPTIIADSSSLKDPQPKCGALCLDGSFSTAFVVS